MVVIHGNEVRELGKIYTQDVAGPDGEWHLVSYKVIAEATLIDLINYIKETGARDTGVYGNYIYFVQMD